MVAKQPNENDNRDPENRAKRARSGRNSRTDTNGKRNNNYTGSGRNKRTKKSDPQNVIGRLQKYHPTITAVATTVIALATVISVVVSAFLYMSAAAANVVATKTANAAQQSVDDAHQNARVELQPYISVTGRITNINSGGSINVRLTVRNTGRTPAENLVVRYTAIGGGNQSKRAGQHPMPCPCCDTTDTRFTRANVPTRLPPGGEAIIDHPFPISVRLDLLRRKHPIRTFGCVTYDSVFQESLSESFKLIQGGPYDSRADAMGQDF